MNDGVTLEALQSCHHLKGLSALPREVRRLWGVCSAKWGYSVITACALESVTSGSWGAAWLLLNCMGRVPLPRWELHQVWKPFIFPERSICRTPRTQWGSWLLQVCWKRTRRGHESLEKICLDLFFFIALIWHIMCVCFLVHCCRFLCRCSKRQFLSRDWLHRILEYFKGIKNATKQRSCSLTLPFLWQMTAVKVNSCFSLFMKHLFPFV